MRSDSINSSEIRDNYDNLPSTLASQSLTETALEMADFTFGRSYKQDSAKRLTQQA